MLVSAEDWQFGVALHQIPMHHGTGWRIAMFVVARIGSYRRVDPKIPLGIGPIDIHFMTKQSSDDLLDSYSTGGLWFYRFISFIW